MAFETVSTVSCGGMTVGECRFFTYRRKQNRGWMDAEDICWTLDELSGEAVQICKAVSTWDVFSLENHFNDSCLLVADRIYVEPEFRGATTWKTLYFATMQRALQQHKRKPDEFFFKAFPLEFEGNVTEANEKEFRRAERNLKLLYAIHLDACSLELPERFGCFMRAPVPPHVLR